MLQRVSNEEPGYDFSKISHGHWKQKAKFTDYLIVIFYVVTPTVLFNLLLFGLHDFLLAHILYQIILIAFVLADLTLYKNFNFDVAYIYEVRNMKNQIQAGVLRMILFAVIVAAAFVSLKYMNLSYAEQIELLMPSGLQPKSLFPKFMHIAYMIFLGIEFVLFMPLIEYRYYFVFVQYKVNNICTTFWIYFFMFGNYLFYMIHIGLKDQQFELSVAYFAVIILMFIFTSIAKRNHGLITALLQQMGMNFGAFLVLTMMLFSRTIFHNPKSLEHFSIYNIWDYTFELFFNREDELVKS
jgi:hypothetical protein